MLSRRLWYLFIIFSPPAAPTALSRQRSAISSGALSSGAQIIAGKAIPGTGCIQQQLHDDLPSKSWTISVAARESKSSGTKISPDMNPSFSAPFNSSSESGKTLTIGFPALAMIKTFPFAASSTRRDLCTTQPHISSRATDLP